MQTVHNIFPALGAPGMLFDPKMGNDIVTAICDEDLQPGRFVELGASDVKPGVLHCQLPQQTGTTVFNGRILGVVIRDMQRENNTWPGNASQPYLKGSRVSILVRGRIFVERDSADTASVSRFDALNIMHSSSDSSKRGMVTKAAAAGTAGSEIGAQTIADVWQDSTPGSGTASSSIALMEVYVK